MTKTLRAALLAVLLTAFAAPNAGATSRIKDLANIEGVRQNQLIGYGLVVGLNGTGDSSSTDFTVQTLVNMMKNMGITVDPSKVKVNNVAAVMVTAKLPAFAATGCSCGIGMIFTRATRRRFISTTVKR